MMLSHEEGLKLWNTRQEDWHKEPEDGTLTENGGTTLCCVPELE